MNSVRGRMENKMEAHESIDPALSAAVSISDQRLRWALEALGGGLWDWDLIGDESWWSPEKYALWGVEPGTPMSLQNTMALVHEDDRAYLRAVLDACIGGSTPYRCEFRIRHPVRGVRWMISQGFLVRDEHGVPSRLRGLTYDITSRKDAEEAMRESEQRYRELVQSANSAIIGWSRDGIITFINEYAQSLFGWSSAEAVGQSVGILLPERDAGGPELPDLARDIVRNPECYATHVSENVCRDGRRLCMAWTNRVILDSRGQVSEILAVGSDITELRDTEAALRVTETRFQRLADAMPQLVWTADSNGVLNYYSSRANEYAGVTPAADGGWSWQAVLHRDDRNSTLDAWRTAVATGQPYACEHRMRMAGGSMRWHLSRAMPVLDDDGRVVQWFGTTTDIHELKLAQEALHESDRRKDEFLATLAHELRNPLASIRNAIEILDHKGTKDQVSRQAQKLIKRQIRHVVRLMDDLLDISRIKLGRLLLQEAPLDLRDLIEETFEACRSLSVCKHRKLELVLPSAPLHVVGDPVRLSQVFTNLVNNACKFTRDEGLVRLVAERQGGDALVRVVDNGVGISDRDLPYLFGLFEQAGSDPCRAQRGLGIGLSLARSLVEMHGGSIEASSDGIGKGSELRVRLPLSDASPEQRLAPDVVHAQQGLPPRRILVVDDNQDIRDSLAILLRLKGHEVVKARDGLEAVESAAQCRPDIILLDIGLPELDGYAACRRIREQPFGTESIIVALTGWGQARDRRDAKDAGFDDHLVKPVESAALLELLKSLDAAKRRAT
jgi:PAS domain S-box-containing protein